MSKKPKRVESPYVSQTDHPRCVVVGERTGDDSGKCTVIAIRHHDGYDVYPHGAEGMCVRLSVAEALKLGGFLKAEDRSHD